MTDSPSPSSRPLAAWTLRLLGGLLVLLGAVLTAGGLWLALLGGSLYYLLAGLGLAVAGMLIFRRQLLGLWVYVALFLATLAWAIWEVGLQGWPLVPRLVGPLVLLVLVLAAAPALAGRPTGRRIALGGLAGLAVMVLAGGVGIALASRDPAPRDLPQPVGGMAEPSVLKAGADWPAYAGTYSARHYSPLNQITPENVRQLQRFWVAHTGDLPDDLKDNKYGAETTPLKVGNALYLCSAKNVMIALDPATGRELWRYDPRVPDEWIPYTAACRGVSYHADPAAPAGAECAARIIEGTLDGRLIAVDARTGRPCSGFGRGGQVDIKVGMGPVTPGMVSVTSPPVVVRDVLVTGHQVLDGQKNDAPSGVIQGFDVRTGQQRWAWDLGRPGQTQPVGPGGMYTRGTPNMWTIASGDEALGLVYLPMGNSAVDYWSSDRSQQENLYSTSLVALDVTTGRPAWRFQTVHMDVWDYDLGSQATLIDFPGQGGAVPALVLTSKQGDIYVLDRRTGRPLTRVEERRAPQGGVEPAQRSPTQPFSGYHTLRRPDLREKDMWGMSPIDQLACRIQFRRAAYRGVYTPPTTDRRWIQYPGYNGGSDWGGVAVDPLRGVIVANYNDMPNYNRLVPREEADRKGWAPRGQARGGDMGSGAEGAGDPQAGAPFAIDVNAGWRLPFTGLLCKQPPYGGIRAIDLRTGRTIWDRPIGQARRNGPFGVPSMLPITIGTPNNGGPLVTAGGVAFLAATTDNVFRAIDLRTGKTLWRDVLPAGGQATPMTYEANGRQYVVIMAGGHHFMETPIGDELIAYALPGT
ncbi:membrane-bound PQQ-dependent dehydrogenase, glucose/quinate/shikimate family [Phenylobacterium sp.]|uniref:membrane-bound PQQ-dependent dehydrogenase, glucose/quinate/shikimate family n=1 Tax=Phenylobacterium sp. TaxID=1871053 RepID=UPI0035AEF80C